MLSSSPANTHDAPESRRLTDWWQAKNTSQKSALTSPSRYHPTPSSRWLKKQLGWFLAGTQMFLNFRGCAWLLRVCMVDTKLIKLGNLLYFQQNSCFFLCTEWRKWGDGKVALMARVPTFQINTKGAEVLYNTIKEIAEVSPVTTLLDICCGTGKLISISE